MRHVVDDAKDHADGERHAPQGSQPGGNPCASPGSDGADTQNVAFSPKEGVVANTQTNAPAPAIRAVFQLAQAGPAQCPTR